MMIQPFNDYSAKAAGTKGKCFIEISMLPIQAPSILTCAIRCKPDRSIIGLGLAITMAIGRAITVMLDPH
jgi:hypothetical protein